MNTEETVMYITDNTGALREWAIHAEDNEIFIRHGQTGGSMQYKTEMVESGKATRSLDEQIMSRMASRISKQRDKGYTNSRVEALANRATNTLGMPKPMLAKKIRDVRNIDYSGAIAQPKFDGNRCLIYCRDGINYAYSRQGKPINAIEHILNDLKLPEGYIVDGELYHHGTPLQTIVSWIKRKQENTLKLNYHLYDIVSNLPYKLRSDLIRGIPIGSSISLVYGDSIASHEALLNRFRDYRKQGYEGAILRWGTAGYEDGKRSSSLVKVKEWESEEFTVVDIGRSKNDWAILECRASNGAHFTVSAPGTMEEKSIVLNNPNEYIGLMVTVEYANLTKAGIPFHPIAINWRDDIQ